MDADFKDLICSCFRGASPESPNPSGSFSTGLTCADAARGGCCDAWLHFQVMPPGRQARPSFSITTTCSRADSVSCTAEECGVRII